MSMRMTTRFIAKHPTTNGHTPTWFGTCPKWAADAEASGMTVTREPVMVVNPQHDACGDPSCPAMTHIRVPSPSQKG